jgi:hypothetical protein
MGKETNITIPLNNFNPTPQQNVAVGGALGGAVAGNNNDITLFAEDLSLYMQQKNKITDAEFGILESIIDITRLPIIQHEREFERLCYVCENKKDFILQFIVDLNHYYDNVEITPYIAARILRFHPLFARSYHNNNLMKAVLISFKKENRELYMQSAIEYLNPSDEMIAEAAFYMEAAINYSN